MASIVVAPLALITIAMLVKIGVYRYQKESYIGARYLQIIAAYYLLATVSIYAIFGWQTTIWLIVPKLFLVGAMYRAAFNFHSIISRQSNISFARDAHQYMVKHDQYDLVESALLRQKVKLNEN
ncbi:hypothetical protein OTK49_02280 [Vibrio coralliirubri]|uniref:hypothetical protein n=1 Tax=Vibrio coralliirubri TaxID=1516159 RepID=UPI0022844728|nr:hypothetical protein [Vibrio coralliirubri]MCY9861343.1 hypothetical protein [Vibrio coralliirubri]